MMAENKQQWNVRKGEIKEIFRETRKHKQIFPYDIQDESNLDEIRSKTNLELSDMMHIRHSIGEYIKSKLKRDKFDIDIVYSSKVTEGLPFMINAPKGGDEAIIHLDRTNCFERQIVIAEALAFISLAYISRETNDSTILLREDVLYLASKLLELYSKMDNGSILRSRYVLPADKIADEITRIYPSYSPDKSRKKDEIDSLLKEILEDFLEKVLKKYPKFNVPPLYSEKKTVENYIKNKYSDTWQYPDISKFKISFTPADIGRDRPFGRVGFHHNEKIGNIGSVIMHTPVENLKIFLSNPEIKTSDFGITPANAQNIVRVIMAHELAHIVLHYKYGSIENYSQVDIGRTVESERDTFYYARLLLEHWEFVYLSEIANKSYIDACRKWKNLISYVYREQRNFQPEYLEWILED